MRLWSGSHTVCAIVMCGSLFAGIAGCDLLQTRDPEAPSSSGSIFIPPTSPDIVIANLQSAIREKVPENYRRCLVDTAFSDRSFQFQPTAEATTRYGGVFLDWTVASEEEYFRNLSSSRTDGVSLLGFFDSTTTSQSSSEVIFTAKYHLVFQHQNTSLGAQEGRGNVQFYIARDQRSEWSIYRWVDLRDTSETTWSDFKGTFISGSHR